MISSIFSYPLYEIRRIQDEPSIIINGVQAFVYQVSEIEGGNIQTNAATIHGNKVASQPSKHLNRVVLMSIICLPMKNSGEFNLFSAFGVRSRLTWFSLTSNIWQGMLDSNQRNARIKIWCLTAWLIPY